MQLQRAFVPGLQLLNVHNQTESSATVRAKVLKVRQLAQERFGKMNARLSKEELSQISQLTKPVINEFEKLVKPLNLSMRSYLRLLRVARTIADLADEAQVRLEHLSEALSYRQIFLNLR